jgi:hypothetical protein
MREQRQHSERVSALMAESRLPPLSAMALLLLFNLFNQLPPVRLEFQSDGLFIPL